MPRVDGSGKNETVNIFTVMFEAAEEKTAAHSHPSVRGRKGSLRMEVGEEEEDKEEGEGKVEEKEEGEGGSKRRRSGGR